MTRLDPAPELDADGGTHLRPGGGHGEQDPREIVGIPPRESEPQRRAREELVQEQDCSTRPARRRRPPRRRPCRACRCLGLRRADEDIGRREQLRDDFARRQGARAARVRRGQGSRQRAGRAPPDARPRPASTPAHGSRARRRGPCRVAISRPSSIVEYPFQGVIRPARGVAGGRGAHRARSRQEEAATSIAWPIPRSFGVGSGKDSSSTLSTTSARRVARRRDRFARQCVYQRPSGIRYSLQSGEARVRNTGTMWARTASGRSAPRRNSETNRRSNASPRPAREPAPKASSRTFDAHRCRPTRSQRTTTSSQRRARAVDHVDRLRREQGDPRRRPG